MNKEGEKHYELSGEVGFPFFGELILDCIHRTENAMTQAHAFKAAELCLQAQEQAIVVSSKLKTDQTLINLRFGSFVMSIN